jgi:C4-dicarboxylate-specific signal transduction histidine kinase
VVGFLASSKPAEQGAFRPDDVQQMLQNVFRSNPEYDAVFLIDTEGRCLAATDPKFVGQKYAFREYFQQAIRGNSYISSILVGQTTRRPGMFFSHPVRSDTGEIVGVTVLKIKGEEIWALVNALQVGSQSYAFLVDQQGIIISHPNQSLLYHSLVTLPPETLEQVVTDRRYGVEQIKSVDIPELAAMVRAKEPGHTSYYSPLEQTHQIVGFAPLDIKPWVLGVNRPKAQFAAPLNRLIWQNGSSVLVVGGITAIIALLLARSIARPIRALTDAAQALEQGDFNPQGLAVVSRTHDDMGRLVRVFLNMAQEVRAREQKLKQQVINLRIEIDETKRVSQVAEITENEHFEQLQKKIQKLKEQAVSSGETPDEYFQRLQSKVQSLKERSLSKAE